LLEEKDLSLHPMVKAAGEGTPKVLGINLCTSPTSIMHFAEGRKKHLSSNREEKGHLIVKVEKGHG